MRMSPHGGGELGNAVETGQRNQSRSALVEGGGERQDQPIGVALIRVPENHGKNSHAGYRDPISPDPATAGIAENARRPDHVVVVLEGLTLSLEDDAGDGALWRFAPHDEHLLNDLEGLEVPQKAHSTRLAEATRQSAARLRRDADAPARLFQGYSHRLEGRPG